MRRLSGCPQRETYAARGSQLHAALVAEDSAAVFCLRGGFGAALALEALSEKAPSRQPKLFVGFSDLTHVHSWLTQRWEWPTVHGAHLLDLSRDPMKRVSWEAMVFGHAERLFLRDLVPLNDAALNIPRAGVTGRVCGGALNTLRLAVGTPWGLEMSSTHGAILLIEDGSCEPFNTERMLVHLRQAGVFAGSRCNLWQMRRLQGSCQRRLQLMGCEGRSNDTIACPVRTGDGDSTRGWHGCGGPWAGE